MHITEQDFARAWCAAYQKFQAASTAESAEAITQAMVRAAFAEAGVSVGPRRKRAAWEHPNWPAHDTPARNGG